MDGQMTIHLRVVIAVMILVTLAIFVNQTKKKNLELQYTLSWLFLLFMIFLVIIFPDILTWVSNILGIAAPVNMVFFLGFIFALIIIYRLTKAVSEQSVEIKDLAQHSAILEKRIEELENKKSNSSAKD